MKIKLLSKTAKMPEMKREGDAAYDIYLPRQVFVEPHSIEVVGTGIAAEIPKGYCGTMVIRSSIANKYKIIIQNALIDSNYRGEIHIIILNNSDHAYIFSEGDRICSLLLMKIGTPKLTQAEELSESNRGTSWNGSSGK